MSLTQELAYATMSPSAAFSDLSHFTKQSKQSGSHLSNAWADSRLNPENRIDSLTPVETPTWRIDGCTSMGRRFFTTPIFLQPLIPLRIDTFIPPASQWPSDLVEILDIDAAFLCRDSSVARYGISQHILRTLEFWSRAQPSFRSFYESMPFGSRIIFENMAADPRQIRIRVARSHDFERQFLSIASLQMVWKGLSMIAIPPLLDITCLRFMQQLHDSTSMVKIESSEGNSGTFVLKSPTDSPKHLYHELKILLSIPGHENIMPRPVFLITKKCGFGGKVGVVGFVTHYEPQGTLRDILPSRRIDGKLFLIDQIKWAQQITQSLIHIQTQGPGYYCDLRLDNILLSGTDDALLIDLEQRGLMPPFAAPEVNYLQYVEILANDQSLPQSVVNKYQTLRQRDIVPHLLTTKNTSRADSVGYSIPWLCLTAREREAAEVYMLGRVFWCIFEGTSAPETTVWLKYKNDPDLTFPKFCRTPMCVRGLIESCIKGWAPSKLQRVMRIGTQLASALDSGRSGDDRGDPIQLLQTGWIEELANAERFLEQRRKLRLDGDVDGFGRPTLKAVLKALDAFTAERMQ